MNAPGRTRISVNGDSPGVRIDVWDKEGKYQSESLDFSPDEAMAFASKLMILAAVSDDTEGGEMVDSIFGRLLMLYDDIRGAQAHFVTGVAKHADEEEPTAPSHPEPSADESPADDERA